MPRKCAVPLIFTVTDLTKRERKGIAKERERGYNIIGKNLVRHLYEHKGQF